MDINKYIKYKYKYLNLLNKYNSTNIKSSNSPSRRIRSSSPSRRIRSSSPSRRIRTPSLRRGNRTSRSRRKNRTSRSRRRNIQSQLSQQKLNLIPNRNTTSSSPSRNITQSTKPNITHRSQSPNITHRSQSPNITHSRPTQQSLSSQQSQQKLNLIPSRNRTSSSPSRNITNSSMFKILSWNISWGAMSHSTNSINDKTARTLAHEQCYKKALSINNPKWCIDNVINFLINLDNDYHFIGLQEAGNWKYIMDELNKNKNNVFKHIHNISGRNEIVTFYRSDLYKFIKMINDRILDNIQYPGKFKGRPYHIIIFQHNFTKEYYIIINLHNDKNISIKVLELELSKKINKLTDYLKNKEFKVIALGDFNDGNKNYWKGLKPFQSLNNNINDELKNTVLSYNKKPPNTCCMGNTLRKKLGDDTQIGDYILINNKFKSIELIIPPNLEYNAYKYPTSDHLPIAAIIN